MKKTLSLLVLLPMMVIGQTQTENYIKSTIYKVATATSITTPAITQANQNITYFDGLGRPIQQIAHQQSGTGKDIVIPIEYDDFGRQVKEYLPYVPTTAASLDYKSAALTEVMNYTPYVGQNPFSEKRLESSPLNRVLEQAAPGADWALGVTPTNHTIKLDYQTNTATEVKLFTAAASAANYSTDGFYTPTLSQTTNYIAGQLYKTITKDENWVSGNNNTTEEFKNKEGQIVLKKTYGVSMVNNIETNVSHETYYVYDQYGNLSYVIPPLVDTSSPITPAVKDDLCYQYKYDYRNRLVEKKLPGKQWEFIVYDKLDRVVATGPAFSPFTDLQVIPPATPIVGWLITKYEAFNRPVYTGWEQATTITSTDRQAKQNTMNALAILNETKQTSGTIDGIAAYYSNAVTPTTFKLLTVNYYDDYVFPNAPSTIPSTVMSNGSQAVYYNATIKPKSLSTGSWSRALQTAASINGETTYILYDNKARPVRTYTKNYLGGFTQTDSQIDFAGKTLNTQTNHLKYQTSSYGTNVIEAFTYTPQDRLLTRMHSCNGGVPTELLSENTYNELGQLISKKVGKTSANPLQKVDYSYNIRGWLKGINNVGGNPVTDPNPLQQGSDPLDLFAFKINYQDNNKVATYPGENLVKPIYNGNISETFWRTFGDNMERKYGYSYDDMNRLKNAVYEKPFTTTPVTNMYNESLTYDKNGNIMSLQRNGNYDAQTMPVGIDNLSYQYLPNSNRLLWVKDNSNNNGTLGFKDGANSNLNPATDYDYAYDANGNMIIDQNKGITSIKYNHLNLPTEIVFVGTGKKINYIYSATGVKLQKMVLGVTKSTDTKQSDYLGGFQYVTSKLNATVLMYPTAEGYVSNDASFNRYVYNYTDHLGNVRSSYSFIDYDYGYNPQTGIVGLYYVGQLKIMEENHYYPFGLKHTNYSDGIYVQSGSTVVPASSSPYKYKYNGKELQDELSLNLYDYGARNYDPALGRWMNIDNLSEKYFSSSPYHFSGNNPVLYLDVDGNEFTEDAWKWVNRLIDNINSRQSSNNKSIAEAKQTIASGKFGWFQSEKSLTNKINRLTNENKDLETTRGETVTLAASNQIYDVVNNSSGTEKDALGNSTTTNQTTFNSDNNRVQLTVSSGTDLGLFSHELKHMFQFETGESSLGLTKNNGGVKLNDGNLMFYDLSDEVEAYKRGALFGQRENVTTTADILSRGLYSDKIPTGPINATNHPQAAGIMNDPQASANKYLAAFRIGTTTYKPQ